MQVVWSTLDAGGLAHLGCRWSGPPWMQVVWPTLDAGGLAHLAVLVVGPGRPQVQWRERTRWEVWLCSKPSGFPIP